LAEEACVLFSTWPVSKLLTALAETYNAFVVGLPMTFPLQFTAETNAMQATD
jgi:hypothetical protein